MANSELSMEVERLSIFKAQRQKRITALEADLAEKSRLLDDVNLQVKNKDRLLSEAYDRAYDMQREYMQQEIRQLKHLNYSLDVQLRREMEERQTIERQMMVLNGTCAGVGYVVIEIPADDN